MYDVVYLDERRRPTVIAAGVPGSVASAIARDEARARDAGRMFSPGSEPPCQGRLVLIVATGSGSDPRRDTGVSLSPVPQSAY